jgi:2-succinyl-6-hydroxy-2,4-cyclohexadiene-1-carboxylate synthase
MHAQRVQHRAENVANSLRRFGTGVQPNFWPRLHQLRMPVTLLVGDGDAKFQGIAARIMAAVPQAKMVIIPGAGHNVHFEQPARFLEALEDANN